MVLQPPRLVLLSLTRSLVAPSRVQSPLLNSSEQPCLVSCRKYTLGYRDLRKALLIMDFEDTSGRGRGSPTEWASSYKCTV